MKKIFTLVAVLGMAAFANAQSFVFTLNGQELADGATVEVKAVEYQETYTTKKGETFTEWLIDCVTDKSFLLTNKTNSDIPYEGVLTVAELTKEWDLSWCMGLTCKTVDSLPMTINEVLPANGTQSVNYHADIEPQISDFGTLVSTITVTGNGESRSVNVKFVYDETSNGVNDVKTNVNTEKACYSLDGRLLNGVQKGLNIVRMTDGTVRKVLVK